YSPGLNRKSITAPIKKVNSGVYLVDVTGIGSDTTESWITFYPNGNTFYVFTPPNYNKGNVEVKMKKVDW
ncbi:MAG: hypothetical protein J7576_23370, partial [Siphonobacter aquaeclarae]|nr:hypothetical protein [Siphonobacter aquaeclarae]